MMQVQDERGLRARHDLAGVATRSRGACSAGVPPACRPEAGATTLPQSSVRVAGLRAAAGVVYDGAVAPFLAAWNRRQLRRRASIAAGVALYPWLLGDAFARLPQAVQRLHLAGPTAVAAGHGTVTLGTGRIARLLAWLLGVPAAGVDRPLRVTVTRSASGGETLCRRYPDATLTTTQHPAGSAGSGLLAERFGPVALVIRLEARAHGLTFMLRRATLFGLPLPRFLAPTVQARETADDGVYRFFVRVDLPGLGRLIQYQGSLPEITDG